jgi:hypothetical protein
MTGWRLVAVSGKWQRIRTNYNRATSALRSDDKSNQSKGKSKPKADQRQKQIPHPVSKNG